MSEAGRFEPFWTALDAVPVEDDAEALYDVSTDAGRLRRENLTRYLSTVGAEADTLLVAEAPGWRGMTNTGVPFTSMRELGPEYLVPPDPTAPWEASSRVVQAALAEWRGPLPLTWAIFPHHPFAAPDRRTNRTPRPAEIRAGAPVALTLLSVLGTRSAPVCDTSEGGTRVHRTGREDRTGTAGVRVVAVGRKAQGALALAGIDAVAVRHPAQGGAKQFTEQVLALNV